MKWKQIFEIARKTGTFTDADLKMARSWPDCAVGDKLHSMNYDKSYAHQQMIYTKLSISLTPIWHLWG